MKKTDLGRIARRIGWLTLTFTLLMSMAVFADGWKKSGKTYYYEKEGDEGETERATGLTKIGKNKFYFNEDGVLQTGMVKIGKSTYFFKRNGKIGKHGMMVKKKFVTWKGSRYYFGKNGKMVTNRWISKYYLGEDGKKLVSTVTPDNYWVDKNGKKVKRLKGGLVKLEGKYYYWDKNTREFLKNTTQTIKGVQYTFDEEGVGTTQASESKKDSLPRILLVAGHGQGDGGAASALGTEYLKTREFAALIYEELKTSDKVDVTYYKNGSRSYDLYQQNKATLGSAGANISTRITGSGAAKNAVQNAIKRNANIPALGDYDYILEVHFNATAASGKDIGGDGGYKGFGFYINNHKSKTALESNICSKIRTMGFRIWGGSGLMRSSTLFNARVCQELGVNYALVETAFIDDADDMRFYNGHKTQMAKAISDAIVAYHTK